MSRIIELEGLKKVEKVPWKDIQPGMIFLGGVRINDTVPYELRNFPVLSASLVEELSKKYYFLSRRDILVVRAMTGYSPSKLSRQLQEAGEMIEKLNMVRSAFVTARQTFLNSVHISPPADAPLWETEAVEQSVLVTDQYNSFKAPITPIDLQSIPSLFHDCGTSITPGHLLTKKIHSHFNLPMDEEVLLHLVVDCSRGMEQGNKHPSIFTALEFFCKKIRDVCKNTEIMLYAFSDECKRVQYPVSGKEVPKLDSRYATFIKKVLHHKDTNRRNKVVLFTDKKPADPRDVAHYGRLFIKNNIDYTQVILGDSLIAAGSGNNDETLRLMYRECTEVASVCGGNQIVLRFPPGVPVVALECYNRYIGLLTFLDPAYFREQKVKEIRRVRQARGYEEKTGKVVKKWQPKVIKRGS